MTLASSISEASEWYKRAMLVGESVDCRLRCSSAHHKAQVEQTTWIWLEEQCLADQELTLSWIFVCEDANALN
jgi:hypothetical protein